MIVTVGNTKGGVGKTTLAVQLALARALTGRDVLVVDGDRQGSAQTAIAVRAEAGRLPGLTCVHYPDGVVLRPQVMRQASKYDDVVIDAGGRDSTALRAALALSDLLIVPFLPRSIDVWALADIAALVDEARGVRDGLRAYAALNAADPGTSSDNTGSGAGAWRTSRSSRSWTRRSAGVRHSRMRRRASGLSIEQSWRRAIRRHA